MADSDVQIILDTASKIDGRLTFNQAAIDAVTSQRDDLQGQVTQLQADKTQLQADNRTLKANLDAVQQNAARPLRVSLASLTEHNVSSSPRYNKANFPFMFTGTTSHGGITASVPVDSNLYDDSENVAAPVNVSHLSLRTLMPANWRGRIMNWRQAWWGAANHPDIGYSTLDPAAMAIAADDSASNGIEVEVLDWYGLSTTGSGNDAILDVMIPHCVRNQQNFCISIDAQYLTQKYQPAQYQQALVSAVTHFAQKYFSHPNYEKANGKPLLLLWNVASTAAKGSVNWQAVKDAIGGNVMLIQYQDAGFAVQASDGALFWLDSNADTNTGIASGVTYLTKYALPSIAAHQNQIGISTVIPGFNGTLTRSTGWSLGKYLDRRGGQTWLDWWKANFDFVASGKRLDYVCIVTWDDYQEGSAIQPGIRNDVQVDAGVVNSQLTWSVKGNESTVHHYDVYASTDGITATKISSVSTGAPKVVSLTNIAPAGAVLYVQAVGHPRITNKLSAGVPYLG